MEFTFLLTSVPESKIGEIIKSLLCGAKGDGGGGVGIWFFTFVPEFRTGEIPKSHINQSCLLQTPTGPLALCVPMWDQKILTLRAKHNF